MSAAASSHNACITVIVSSCSVCRGASRLERELLERSRMLSSDLPRSLKVRPCRAAARHAAALDRAALQIKPRKNDRYLKSPLN